MGKLTLIGPVPPDDPMFSSGPELWSHPGYEKYAKPTSDEPNGQASEELPDARNDGEGSNRVETEEDAIRAGALRLRKMQHQSEAFMIGSGAVSKGKPNSNSTSGENEPK